MHSRKYRGLALVVILAAMGSGRPGIAPAAEKTAEEKNAALAPITISGRALDFDGKPISAAEIFLASPRNTDHPLAKTKTDAEGRYRFDGVMLPLEGPAAPGNPVAGQGVGSFELFGRADGFGVCWRPLKWFYPDQSAPDNVVTDPGADLPERLGGDDLIELDLLFGPAATLRGQLVDDQGAPLAGATVAIRRGQPVDDEDDQRNLESWNWPALVPADVKSRTSDKEGRFEFTTLPENYKFWIDVRAAGHSPRSIWAATAANVEEGPHGEQIHEDDFQLILQRPRHVKLRIVYGDTREPAEKVGVASGNKEISFWGTTDDDGLVEIPLPDGKYQVTISPRWKTPYLNTKSELVVSADAVLKPVVVELRPAAVVDITVVDDETHEPLEGVDVWEEIVTDDGQLLRESIGYRSWEVETRISHYDRPRSDKRGKMRVLLEPGERQIGIALEAGPKGYLPSEPQGKVIDCRPGVPMAVEFSMSK